MFIELAEFLKCPADHDERPCVLSVDEMEDRSVVRGAVGCPSCDAQYPIVDGAVHFGSDPMLDSDSRSDDLTVEEMPEVDVVHALLSVAGPGGYVALVGSAGRLSSDLARRIPDVHFVAVNPPPEVGRSTVVSPLQATEVIPLRSSTMRGIVVGSEYASESWLVEGARVLLRCSRIVSVGERVSISGVTELAVGDGLWVGERISPAAHQSS